VRSISRTDLFIWVIFAFFLGACSHEADLARNYAESGDAKGWFHGIRCEGLK
jgi:hypothetical protein